MSSTFIATNVLLPMLLLLLLLFLLLLLLLMLLLLLVLVLLLLLRCVVVAPSLLPLPVALLVTFRGARRCKRCVLRLP